MQKKRLIAYLKLNWTLHKKVTSAHVILLSRSVAVKLKLERLKVTLLVCKVRDLNLGQSKKS